MVSVIISLSRLWVGRIRLIIRCVPLGGTVRGGSGSACVCVSDDCVFFCYPRRICVVSNNAMETIICNN